MNDLIVSPPTAVLAAATEAFEAPSRNFTSTSLGTYSACSTLLAKIVLSPLFGRFVSAVLASFHHNNDEARGRRKIRATSSGIGWFDYLVCWYRRFGSAYSTSGCDESFVTTDSTDSSLRILT